MKHVGIYKPGKKIYFYDNEDDHASWSAEVIALAKIIASFEDNKVYILSETDYIENEYANITAKKPDKLDKIFVFNGKIDDENKLFEELRTYTFDINLIITDLALCPSSAFMASCRRVYAQSASEKYPWRYLPLAQAPLFDHQFNFYPETPEKKIHVYFGGTERGRTADFMEYIHRPGVEWYGKSESLGIKNYIPFHEHIEKLKSAKYTIVIGDEKYNKIGFVTPRYYEAIKYDVIAFVDKKFDPDELIVPMNDFCRVDGYLDMMKKIQEIDSNPIFRDTIIAKQRCRHNNDTFEGRNIYKSLDM